jgi:hypothetical protein
MITIKANKNCQTPKFSLKWKAGEEKKVDEKIAEQLLKNPIFEEVQNKSYGVKEGQEGSKKNKLNTKEKDDR